VLLYLIPTCLSPSETEKHRESTVSRGSSHIGSEKSWRTPAQRHVACWLLHRPRLALHHRVGLSHVEVKWFYGASATLAQAGRTLRTYCRVMHRMASMLNPYRGLSGSMLPRSSSLNLAHTKGP